MRCVLTITVLALYSLTFAGSPSQTVQAQTVSPLYNFGSNAGDPTFPAFEGIVAQGRDGNLYSTTQSGGANNLGAAFKITPAGTLTVIHSFDSTEGTPFGGLTLGLDGNLYGTTENGGTFGAGTVFKITP